MNTVFVCDAVTDVCTNGPLDSVVPETVTPQTLLVGVAAGLSLGWTAGSVLAGEPPVEYLPLVAVGLAMVAVMTELAAGE